MVRHPRLLVATCCGCVAVIIGLTAGAIAVLPAIGADLRASQSDLQWVGDAFPLVIAGLLLPAGAALDRYGRRRGMLVGLVLMAACLVGNALATAIGPLIALRCAAGVAAALVFPGTLATLTAVLPEEQRRRAVAMWAFSMVIGAIAGLLLCSLVTQLVSWQASFLVLAGVVLALLALTAAVVPETRAQEDVPLDPLGCVLSAGAIGGLALAVTDAPLHGWTSATTLASAAAGAALLVAFVVWERRRAQPLLDVRLFAHGPFGAAAAALFVLFLAHFGFVFLAFQYESYVLGYSTLGAALGIVPPTVGFVLTPFSPRIAQRFGRRRTIVGGLALCAAGTATAAAMAGAGEATYATFAIGAAITWCGMGLAMAPPTEMIIEAVPAAKQGVASAVNDLAREVAAAFGIAIAGSAFNSAYRGSIEDRVAALDPRVAAAAISSPAAGREALRGTAGGAQVVTDAVLAGWTLAFATLTGILLVGAAVVWRRCPAGVAAAAAPRAEVLAVSP